MALQAPNAARARPERYFLAVALVLPLIVALLLLTQIPGTGFAAPNTPRPDDSTRLVSKRPAPSNAAPPPTLVPPAATSTPIPQLVTADAPPQKPDGYVVQPGDELKQIAAAHHVSMAQIIAANDIPDPDSLRVGQVLRIPGQ
jgi:LysM repeat protein